jgi:hypothetical protein
MVEFNKLIQAQFDKMCATGKLFRSSVTGQRVWELYINGFEKKYNPIFRDPESSVNNCNLCKNFIRRYGNVVAIFTMLICLSSCSKDEDVIEPEIKEKMYIPIISLDSLVGKWDLEYMHFKGICYEYPFNYDEMVAKDLAKYINSFTIYPTTIKQIGILVHQTKIFNYKYDNHYNVLMFDNEKVNYTIVNYNEDEGKILIKLNSILDENPKEFPDVYLYLKKKF